MATQSTIQPINNTKSPLLPTQQSADDNVTYSATKSTLLPNDAAAQRSGSTRRNRTSGQLPATEPTILTQMPSAPDPPKASRGPPLSYRGPYEEERDQYVDRSQPSMRSFAARAGILPEQMSPQSPQFPNQDTQEGSPVFSTKPSVHKVSQNDNYQRSPVTDDRREYNRKSQPQTQNYPKSPNEARYGLVNEAKAVYHQRPMSDVPRGANGPANTNQTTSPRVDNNDLPVRSKSQRYSTSQQLMATEKSPLQKLELKFNDISKEEKRARVEQAEQKLREKESTSGRRVSQSDVPTRQSSASRRSVSGPIYQRIADQARTSSQRRSQHVTPSLHVNTHATDEPLAAVARPVSNGDRVTPSNSRRTSTGGNRNDDRGVRFNTQLQDADQVPVQQAVSGAVSAKNTPTKVPRGDTTRVAGGVIESEAQQADLTPRQSALKQNGHATYTVPPQTAAGAEARKSVGFGSSIPQQTQGEDGHSHHHLSNLFHRHKNPIAGQSQPARGLDEWRKGGVAFLSLADMKTSPKSEPEPEDEDYQAWWEAQQSGTAYKRQSKATPKVDSADGYFDDQSVPVAFNPPLLLKCGPLLRYCGMRKEKPSQKNRTGSEIWRGSVMIVTDDSQSSYDTVPSLRLFHQPMQLLPPPPKQFDEDAGEGLDSEYVDPIGGLPRITRTGGMVYVKPVEDLDEGKDVSRIENDDGLYEETRTANVPTSYGKADELLGRSPRHAKPPTQPGATHQVGRYREVKGIRLHAERGFTFWRFKLEVELGNHQQRIAYRINKGASVGLWVPARGKSMNIMFHSCNGFSSSVDSNLFSGPDPLWRDVLNAHQLKPFHVMIGGGDQIYNDAVTKQTTIFKEWLEMKNPHHKHEAPFTVDLRNELEDFYLNRYAMWFSQGLFGMANSQIPMINMWDDHDIIDGFGSYPHHFMSSPVFSGVGNVAFKYYMLFQQQSVTDELTADEPSWLLGASPGPYIHELSRSLFMFLGSHLAFLGLDCRTERMRDEILSEASYDLIFERCHREIIKGETKHLIVLLGVPIAYPRLVWLENVLTSRVMDPVKALGRMGLLGNFTNKFDGGVEILDDLDDHWTAKNHKEERNWFIEELQELAAEKSIRITILGGDVHLAAIGQFFSNKNLKIPKDRDFRYMPNIISSAIVNTPPPDMMADVLNKRNKIHHLNAETDENMIPMFTHDVDGKPRNNKHLLPKRNWCSISEYIPGSTPPPTPPSSSPTASETSLPQKSPGILQRTLSLGRGDSIPGTKLIRRLSLSNRTPSDSTFSPHGVGQPSPHASVPPTPKYDEAPIPTRPVSGFHRRPTNLSEKAAAKGAAHDDHVDLEFGLDVSINCEIKQGDPSGSTEQYRLLIPALMYDGPLPEHGKRKTIMNRFASVRKSGKPYANSNASIGSRAGSRDSWAGHDKKSADNQSISSQDSQTHHGPPVQAGLFRRLSNRLSRSASQNRGQETRGNLLQKRRVSLDAQPPTRTLEPFKPRPTPQANAQVHQQAAQQQQQPLQSAMRHSSADTSGAYTVTNNSPRSPPTSFSQKPYNPAAPTAAAITNTPPRKDMKNSTGTAYNRTAPLPQDSPPPQAQRGAPAATVTNNKRNTRNYSFSSSDRSDHLPHPQGRLDQNHNHKQNNNHMTTTNYTDDDDADYDDNENDSFSSGREYDDDDDDGDVYPSNQPPRSGSNAVARNQPRQSANAPSGRGGGAAKFFGEDLPTATNVTGAVSQRNSTAHSHGGYSGIEAYGHGHGHEADGNGSGGGKEKKGWRKFF